MNAALSDGQLEEIDRELAATGVSLRYLALDSFKKTYGSVQDDTERERLFDPIIAWYLSKYGNSVRWDGVIARFVI